MKYLISPDGKFTWLHAVIIILFIILIVAFFIVWGEDMKTGLELARGQVEKRFNEAKVLLEKTLEDVSYEELKEACGFADGLEYALIVLDTFIELEGGKK